MTHLSPNYLNRLFRQWTDQSIGNYIPRRRMERAMELCGEGRLLIKQVAAETGYGDPLYFSRAFHRYFFGRWPSTVRGASVSSPPR